MPEYTRPPDRNDLITLCRELNRLQAKYIVIGGLAMNALGLIRTTEDIDLLIEESPPNQEKVKAALRILPDKAIDELGEEDIRDFVVVRINDEITIDLMTQACGLNYDRAKDLILKKTFDEVAIPFAGRELMIKTKQTVREKDMIDLRYLESIQDTDVG
jgi:antitoxin component of RelBE/YafQ-DinJ toxin-antitoxin module